jgi:hypothetical protein
VEDSERRSSLAIGSTKGPNVQFRYLDGMPVAGRERELVMSATVADLTLASALAASQEAQTKAKRRDMKRLGEILHSVTGWAKGEATVDEALAMLSPADRAEAEAIKRRLDRPDGAL